MNNEPVAWMDEINTFVLDTDYKQFPKSLQNGMIPLYTHPVKEQLSNGHLSDCAIHNEPASRNKPCDCGFEPKFNLSDLKHEDNCRYFDDGEFCTCGAEDSALVDWYRHKEETHPIKELTDEEITEMAKRKANQILMDLLMPDVGNERRIDWNVGCTREHLKNFAKAILRKAQEK